MPDQAGDSAAPTLLCDLALHYGVDKCPGIFHSYTPVYNRLLESRRHLVRHVLEIGVGTPEVMNEIVGPDYRPGASLRMWRDFFPGAQVFGCDLEPGVLFTEDRIRTFQVDQSDRNSLLRMIDDMRDEQGRPPQFDLIVDDGSHIVEHMTLTFEVLWPFLTQGGIFVVEDVKAVDRGYFAGLAERLGIGDAYLLHHHRGEGAWDDFVAFGKAPFV